MTRYFKWDAESDVGVGVAYFEFDGEYAKRQVEYYEGRWFSSRKEYHPEVGPGLSDQPLSTFDLRGATEISQEEFERAWSESEAAQE